MILPFIDPEDDIYINLGILLILINSLSKTNRGTLKLNNTKLHIFLYLLKNPTTLNKVLSLLGKGNIALHERDSYSVTSISPNLDPLFDRRSLKSLISILVSKELISVEYKKNDGFLYHLSDKGKFITNKLDKNHFKDIINRCHELKKILSLSDTQLNRVVNQNIKSGS